MFRTECEYLVHLLRCAIHDQKPEELPEGLSFQNVFRYGLAHDVANLAFYALEKLEHLPEKELFDRWRLRRDLAISRDLNQQFAREEIVQELKGRGIPFLEVQGTVLKKLYPRSEYRTMSDIDLIVKPEHLLQCGEVLGKLGYRWKNTFGIEIDGERAPNILVEIHTVFFSERNVYGGIMKPPFSIEEPTPKDVEEELYLYSILHVAKHYFSSGCGIRRVLDMYLINRAYGECADSPYIKSALEKAKLTEFASDMFRLAESWFSPSGDPNFQEPMAMKLLHSAVHGTTKQMVASDLNKLSDSSEYTVGLKLKYLLLRVFPGDNIMLLHYPFLAKYRFLYPIFWVHRILKMLFSEGLKRSFRTLRQVIRAKK